MKRWAAPSITARYVPDCPEILARATMCRGMRRNMNPAKRYTVRVFSHDQTPLTDAVIAFHVEHKHG